MLGPSTGSIVEEAKQRGIPTQRLNDESFIQLGYGAKQRRIQATLTDRTSALGAEITSALGAEIADPEKDMLGPSTGSIVEEAARDPDAAAV